MTVDNKWNIIYCIFLAMWSTIFVESWKRKQSEFAFIWNMDGFIRKDDERQNFECDYIID